MGNEIFEKNLKAMEKWYPKFAELVRCREPEDDAKVSAEMSWDGEKIFRVQKGDRILYLGGKRNAAVPIKIWVERMGEMRDYAPVFLFGLGSGAYLKALIQNTKKKVNVVAYEPSDAIFLRMLREVDLSREIESRPIAFVVGGINEDEFPVVMKRLLVLENLEFLREEIHPNYKELYLEEVAAHVRPLHQRMEHILTDYFTMKKLSTHLAQNVLRNLPYICEGHQVRELAKVIPSDRAAVLVSAGPSLNKNIKELKKAKNKLFILAVDTAIKPLLKEGIVPDVFGTIDAKKVLSLIEAEGSEHIPVVAPPVALHAMLKRQQGKRIFYGCELTIPDEAYRRGGGELPYLEMGGSVACMCFTLLYRINFRTIILMGQDLAYTNNKSHADGTFQEAMPEEDTRGMRMVRGNCEERVPTPPTFKMFLDWFEDYIKGAKERCPSFRVINATEGGAYIEGTEIMTLRDALEEACHGVEDTDFGAMIRKMEPGLSPEGQQKAKAYLRAIPGNLRKIARDAGELEKSYRRLQKIGQSGGAEKDGCSKQLRKLKKIMKRVTSMSEYELIDESMPVADYIIRKEYFYEYGKGDTNVELEELGRKGVLYSQLLGECAELLAREAEEALLPWIDGADSDGADGKDSREASVGAGAGEERA